jgi:hypothetical protein
MLDLEGMHADQEGDGVIRRRHLLKKSGYATATRKLCASSAGPASDTFDLLPSVRSTMVAGSLFGAFTTELEDGEAAVVYLVERREQHRRASLWPAHVYTVQRRHTHVYNLEQVLRLVAIEGHHHC